MNTQTHILLAAALLAGPSKSVPNTNGQQGISRTRSRTVNLAVLLGAVLPDLSLFFMWGQAKARGIPDSIIWEELYFSPFWQEVGAITNSIPIFAGIAIIGFIMVGREWLTQHPHFYAKGIGFVLLFLGLAALTHCLTDLPLHVDDGHAHFWPISNWIYSSPVSYWDVNHYANYWQPLEILIAVCCVVAIWRRFRSIWVRCGAIILLVSYALITAYWMYALG